MAACPLEGLVRMSILSPQQKNPLALKLLDEITALAVKHRKELQSKMDERIAEMKEDDISHFLIYIEFLVSRLKRAFLSMSTRIKAGFFIDMLDHSWRLRQRCALQIEIPVRPHAEYRTQ